MFGRIREEIEYWEGFLKYCEENNIKLSGHDTYVQHLENLKKIEREQDER